MIRGKGMQAEQVFGKDMELCFARAFIYRHILDVHAPIHHQA